MHFNGRGSVVESSGADTKIKGTLTQVLERYQALARDAMSAGDRIAAENYLQHADHYYRLIQAHTGNGHPGANPNLPANADSAGSDPFGSSDSGGDAGPDSDLPNA